jgi:phospholipase C
MPKILHQIGHIVVVMFENRSLDDICGWLYPDPARPPIAFLRAGTPARFDGLIEALWNPGTYRTSVERLLTKFAC